MSRARCQLSGDSRSFQVGLYSRPLLSQLPTRSPRGCRHFETLTSPANSVQLVHREKEGSVRKTQHWKVPSFLTHDQRFPQFAPVRDQANKPVRRASARHDVSRPRPISPWPVSADGHLLIPLRAGFRLDKGVVRCSLVTPSQSVPTSLLLGVRRVIARISSYTPRGLRPRKTF